MSSLAYYSLPFPYELPVLAVAGWLRFLRDYDDAGYETPVVGRHLPPAAVGRHEALRTRCR